jgi:AcrR family transcriptional regulator
VGEGGTSGRPISASTPSEPPAPSEQPPPKKRQMRVDAVQNRIRILAAAEEVFAAQGVSAPIDAVAEQAGVGVGTLYRHFSTKEALFEAIVLTRLEELVSAAAGRADADDAGESFFSFLRELAHKVSNKHDLIDALGAAGIDIKSRCSEMATELEASVQQMLTRAQDAGAVRRGITTQEVMGLIVGVCHSAERSTVDRVSRDRMVEIVCDGLRAQTTTHTGDSDRALA